jgi:hypothetical protein
MHLIYVCIRYTQPEKLGPNEYSCGKCGNTFQVKKKKKKRDWVVENIRIRLFIDVYIRRLLSNFL